MATTTSNATPTPALPPPPGVTSNFAHPATLKGAQDIAMGVAIPLTTIFFLLRTYVRIWIKKQWIGEDWLALLAYIGTIAFCGTGAATMKHHGGEHQWDMTRAEAKEAYYWFNVASIHYGITICIAKLAILCLYRRVFSIPRSPFDIAIIFLIVLLVLFYTATNITKIWECVPRARIWDPSIPGKCIDTPMLLNVSGIFNTVTDFIIVMMPFKAVWNLNMKLKKKVYVVLAFTFGMCAPAFSLVGSIVRLRGTNNPDKTWVQPEIIMWGLAELTTGILCVSFPEIGVVFKGRKRRPSAQASTGIRDGRYRREDAAVFGGVRKKMRTWTTSLSTTLAEVNTSSEPTTSRWKDGDGTTTVTSVKEDGGGGGQRDHFELDEVNLINPPATAVSVEGGRTWQNNAARGPGEVEVMREVRVDSASIV